VHLDGTPLKSIDNVGRADNLVCIIQNIHCVSIHKPVNSGLWDFLPTLSLEAIFFWIWKIV
jgi:hypothetical protein